jgi:hypothetical protein
VRRRKTSAGSFVATDDLGRKFTVHIYACRTFADLELRLSDGTTVDRLGKGEYEVSRETGRIMLRSAHPKAP